MPTTRRKTSKIPPIPATPKVPMPDIVPARWLRA